MCGGQHDLDTEFFLQRHTKVLLLFANIEMGKDRKFNNAGGFHYKRRNKSAYKKHQNK